MLCTKYVCQHHCFGCLGVAAVADGHDVGAFGLRKPADHVGIVLLALDMREDESALFYAKSVCQPVAWR